MTSVIYRLTWRPREISYLLLALALTVFAVAPLAYPGYVQVHSGLIPAYNLTDLASQRLNVGWRPTIATSFDPLRSDGLLPYYLALPLVGLGASPLGGVKTVFILSFWLGAAGMYIWLQARLGAASGALAALVYTYLPYRLATVYVRGDWGEALCLGLLPWGLAVAAGQVTSRRYARTGLTLLAWVLVGLSQAGVAVWGWLLLVAWRLMTKQRGYWQLLAALGGILAALVLSFAVAGFSLPPSPINFSDHFLYPAQLLSAYWGFGASRPGWDDGLSLGLGFAAVGLGILAVWLALGQARASSGQPGRKLGRRVALSSALLALALAALTLTPAAWLWRLTGLHYTLTYPWQVLGLASLCLAVLAGTVLRLDDRLAGLPAYAGLVILTLLASYNYLEPRFTQVAPARGPLATWDTYRLMLIDYELSAAIPPIAAGLSEPTPGRLALTDYGALRPGNRLYLALTWQATRPFDRDLKLFVHLQDAWGQVLAQADPLAGTGAGPDRTDYFTSRWAPGELIRDEVLLTIPPTTPAGRYQLAFGLYDADTLQRLPVMGREGGQVEIEIELRDKAITSLPLSSTLHDLEGYP